MNTILIVEDDAVIVRDIRNTLEALGYRAPRTADCGLEALRAVEEMRPDLVLMDVHLKGSLVGIETTARIRAHWNVPIVYLTAHSDDATLARGKGTAPHGYLLKPFDDQDLRTAIEVALRNGLESKLAERECWFSTTLESIGDAVIAASRAPITIATRTDQSGRAVVEGRDTGSGIPAPVQTHMSDPFFSTKGVGEGMCLGRDAFSEPTSKFLETIENLTPIKPFTADALHAVIADQLVPPNK